MGERQTEDLKVPGSIPGLGIFGAPLNSESNEATTQLHAVPSACSVAASYKPPMLVTRVRLPACACVAPLAGTNMSVWSMGHRLPAQRAWAMVAGLLLPTPLGWQRATHKHQYPAWTSCVSASSSVCAAGTRQNLFTGLARVLRAFLGPTATEWKYLPLCIDGVSGGKW